MSMNIHFIIIIYYIQERYKNQNLYAAVQL